MTRLNFEYELSQMHIRMIDMGSYVETAIEDSIKAFMNNDLALCRTIIENDKNVDIMEKEMESKCLWLIARQQPIASDLRKITAALMILTDMERIGDHAADIAEISMRISDRNTFADSSRIPQMAAAAIEMVHNAVTAYVNYDVELAEATRKKDDVVDDYFNTIKHDLVEVFKTQPHNLDNAIDLLLVVKYLERIGDHAVNICDWVCFSKTGKHKDTLVF